MTFSSLPSGAEEVTSLVSFTENDVGVTSIEISVYNSGPKTAKAFPEKGDSGALVWHMKKGKAFIIDQLHLGLNKGGSTANHMTYCTPGEKLKSACGNFALMFT
ncbi:hypothetical protein F5148DRAFT_1293407 [Russula earlei]|uniref:Uncharacterized protein n=1 Tax=Russula earlei TaxID=71964 RepID=A0ACC0TT56_9AGAM|nr:hypothetical protein F5148DRAFT_1293407 [Russula earlei]